MRGEQCEEKSILNKTSVAQNRYLAISTEASFDTDVELTLAPATIPKRRVCYSTLDFPGSVSN